MRAKIDIDDALIDEAMTTGLSPKKAIPEKAPRRLVRAHRQTNALTAMAGLGWEGDLDESRKGRFDGRLE